ncbi:AtpZ/AtpI family protein [Candidatus Peregrinibacteria bacterium]|nr:AtpZ/AtpI family protein [Candidatus Peregrinibacteria bacterium]
MKNNLGSVLNLAWELGYTIALPIAILGFGGAMLDKKVGTSPLFLLIGIALSIIISGIAVYRKIKIISN